MKDDKEKTSMGSKVNSALLTVVIALLGWTVKTTHDLSMQVAVSSRDTTAKLDALSAKIVNIDSQITDIKQSGWTLMHMKIWADGLERANPTVRVPDPAEIKKSYN